MKRKKYLENEKIKDANKEGGIIENLQPPTMEQWKILEGVRLSDDEKIKILEKAKYDSFDKSSLWIL